MFILPNKYFKKNIEKFPANVETVIKQEVLPFWKQSWQSFKLNVWYKIVNLTKPELEKRKEYLKQGFEQEKGLMKEEIKTEASKAGHSLWQKIKNLINKE